MRRSIVVVDEELIKLVRIRWLPGPNGATNTKSTIIRTSPESIDLQAFDGLSSRCAVKLRFQNSCS